MKPGAEFSVKNGSSCGALILVSLRTLPFEGQTLIICSHQFSIGDCSTEESLDLHVSRPQLRKGFLHTQSSSDLQAQKVLKRVKIETTHLRRTYIVQRLGEEAARDFRYRRRLRIQALILARSID
jgi:hypothetical protein